MIRSWVRDIADDELSLPHRTGGNFIDKFEVNAALGPCLLFHNASDAGKVRRRRLAIGDDLHDDFIRGILHDLELLDPGRFPENMRKELPVDAAGT
jgi:hypothetical protein